MLQSSRPRSNLTNWTMWSGLPTIVPLTGGWERGGRAVSPVAAIVKIECLTGYRDRTVHPNSTANGLEFNSKCCRFKIDHAFSVPSLDWRKPPKTSHATLEFT